MQNFGAGSQGRFTIPKNATLEQLGRGIHIKKRNFEAVVNSGACNKGRDVQQEACVDAPLQLR
jgi:hypothetical protein